jgi:ketosteroid isomerase-like protein
MAYYSPDESLFVFDALPPRQYVGAAAYRKNWEGFLAAYPGAVHAEVTDWKTATEGNLAYGHGIFRTTGPDKDGMPLDLTLRVTDVYRKVNGKWLVVHEHVSWPVDLTTGKADLSSKP